LDLLPLLHAYSVVHECRHVNGRSKRAPARVLRRVSGSSATRAPSASARCRRSRSAP
jgi:hypothetical protein